jgi:hypothetical protein
MKPEKGRLCAALDIHRHVALVAYEIVRSGFGAGGDHDMKFIALKISSFTL